MSSLSLPWPLGRGSKRGNQRKEEETEAASAELEEFGVTPQLLKLVEGFTVTFRNFSLQDDAMVVGDGYSSSGINVNKDLSEWRERHAILLLSKAKATDGPLREALWFQILRGPFTDCRYSDPWKLIPFLPTYSAKSSEPRDTDGAANSADSKSNYSSLR